MHYLSTVREGQMIQARVRGVVAKQKCAGRAEGQNINTLEDRNAQHLDIIIIHCQLHKKEKHPTQMSVQIICCYFLTSDWINWYFRHHHVTEGLSVTSGAQGERVDWTAQSHTLLYNPMACLWCITTSQKVTMERRTPSIWWASSIKLSFNWIISISFCCLLF